MQIIVPYWCNNLAGIHWQVYIASDYMDCASGGGDWGKREKIGGPSSGKKFEGASQREKILKKKQSQGKNYF